MISFQKVTRVNFAYVDDLILSDEWRYQGQILIKLFTKVLEVSLLSKIDILITFSIKNQVNLFKGIGFSQFLNKQLEYTGIMIEWLLITNKVLEINQPLFG